LYGVLTYFLAERVAFFGGIEPAFETSEDGWFIGILELYGPRHVNVVCLMLVDGYVQVVSRQSPSLESRDDGGGASFDGVTFWRRCYPALPFLKKGNAGNIHPTPISFL
jgi:hypothetical protein